MNSTLALLIVFLLVVIVAAILLGREKRVWRDGSAYCTPTGTPHPCPPPGRGRG